MQKGRNIYIYGVSERIFLLSGLPGITAKRRSGPCPRLDQWAAGQRGRGQKEPDQGKISVYKTRATCATASSQECGLVAGCWCRLPGR